MSDKTVGLFTLENDTPCVQDDKTQAWIKAGVYQVYKGGVCSGQRHIRPFGYTRDNKTPRFLQPLSVHDISCAADY